MAGGNVMAGFPNPLPDTLHLLLVGLFVYACVLIGRAYACLSSCAYLCLTARTCVSRVVVVYVSRPHLYIRFALTDYACVNCIVALFSCRIFAADMRVSHRKPLEYCEARAFSSQCCIGSPSVRTYVSYSSVGVENGRPLSDSTEGAA